MSAGADGPQKTAWGRLTFTCMAGQVLAAPQDAPPDAPGAFAAGFRAEFDDYLRAQFVRAVEQAQAFVEFVDPEPGCVAVEVGAGGGRMSLDGGVAQRIGPEGQLLMTDPSSPLLDVAIRRAREMGLTWVRALRAPAEDLPLDPGCDLVFGAYFLQFTDLERALAGMARVLRPGGRLAIAAGLDYRWPSGWWQALRPVREEWQRHGLPARGVFHRRAEILDAVSRVGLSLERSRVGDLVVEFPSVEIAIGTWRQNSLVPLLLRGVPADRVAAAQAAFDSATREMFLATSPEERRLTSETLELVAVKPG